MAKPYDFNCDCKKDNTNGLKGRQGEQFFNGELHNVFEAVRHIPDYPANKHATPSAEHLGSLWLDRRTNTLYQYVGLGYKHDRARNGWLPVFSNKFQITDEILSEIPSSNPVPGQLWLCGDTLTYFDGTNWRPVRCLETAESQFNVSAFSDFEIISPLQRMGSAVVSDLELQAFEEIQRIYKTNSLDGLNDETSIFNQKWNFGRYLGGRHSIIDFNLDEVSYQYLIPNIETDRIFMNRVLDTAYEQQSRTVILYPRSYLIQTDDDPLISDVKTPSLVHVNAAKLSNVTKRIVKIDKQNPKIKISAYHTEFYGFRVNDFHGRFLVPSKTVEETLSDEHQLRRSQTIAKINEFKTQLEKEGYEFNTSFLDEYRSNLGDYEMQQDGIFLSYRASQTFDYVMAITYEFNWRNSTGVVRQADNKQNQTSYYIPGHIGSVNVFVNGFDFEDTYYGINENSNAITLYNSEIAQDPTFDVSILKVIAHEYGFVRTVNLVQDSSVSQGSRYRGYFKTAHKFNQPLVFINGECLTRRSWSHYNEGTFDLIAGDSDDIMTSRTFSVPDVPINSCWTIIETKEMKYIKLTNGEIREDGYHDILIEDNGIVSELVDETPCILLNKSVQYDPYEDSTEYVCPRIVLFINGLMIRKQDVMMDSEGRIFVDGLKLNMEYIVLDDSDNNLYSEQDMNPAILTTGRVDQTLVYHDGYLLGDSSAYLTQNSEAEEAKIAVHNEVKAFSGGRAWKIWDEAKEKWVGHIDSEALTALTDTYDALLDNYGGRVYDSRSDAEAAAKQKIAGDTLTEISSLRGDTLKNEVLSFCNSYANGLTSINLLQTEEDLPMAGDHELKVFGYKTANAITNPINIYNFWLHQNDDPSKFSLTQTGTTKEQLLADSYGLLDVFYDSIPDSDPELISTYAARASAYFNFKLMAFAAWKNDVGPPGAGWTTATAVSRYKSHDMTYIAAGPISGYPKFQGDVYLRTPLGMEASDVSLEKLNYLRREAQGVLWENRIPVPTDFDVNTDYLMVWLNGVRQYENRNYELIANDTQTGWNIQFTGVNESGELSTSHPSPRCPRCMKIRQNSGYALNNNTSQYTCPHCGYIIRNSEPGRTTQYLTGILTYVVQKPKTGESSVCRTMIVDHEYYVPNSINIWSTKDPDLSLIDPITRIRDTTHDFPLYPGKITVFLDGIRLPPDAYTILDNFTIRINDRAALLYGSPTNYPTCTWVDSYGNIRVTRQLKDSEILIEVRDNSEWQEREIEVTKDFNGEIRIYERTDLPISIVDTQDQMMIYIDGLYFGLRSNDGYYIDSVNGAILIRDSTVLAALTADPFEEYMTQLETMIDGNPYMQSLLADTDTTLISQITQDDVRRNLMVYHEYSSDGALSFVYDKMYGHSLASYRARNIQRGHSIILEWR